MVEPRVDAARLKLQWWSQPDARVGVGVEVCMNLRLRRRAVMVMEGVEVEEVRKSARFPY